MSREIKFRAWDEASKQMMYKNVWERNWYIDNKVALPTHPDNQYILKLMQYIGLKDRRGQEIYEGDVCTCELGINDRLDRKSFIVKYANNSFILDSEYVTVEESFDYWEVIGNIHENPELLK